MNRSLPITPLTFILCCIITSCNDSGSPDNAEVSPETISPVTIITPSRGTMSETVEVNAISSFLLKTYVKASANGYLQEVKARMGAYVVKGQALFVIKTKEAEALGNTINSLDTSLHFQGTITVRSPGNGYISQLSYTSGNYVQDGDQLAEITDTKSFVFILDLPYELKPYLTLNKNVHLKLPDSTIMQGRIISALPSVDSVAQTQRFIIKVKTTKLIPENLIAKVTLVKKEKDNTIFLPKAAVLSNEVQSEFWIIKLINDTTAVKLPVQKGIETKDKIEILSPPLSDSERIVLTGNYGLEDTARVKVIVD